MPIGKRAKYRYERKLKQFEAGIPGVTKPKVLVPHIDSCKDCNGAGITESESFLRPNSDYPHIAIIGGGIGGVALVAACLHRGIPYTLYERDTSFDARSQGYGLTLQQASKAIEGLGIFELEGGITSTRHVVLDTTGKVIGEWGRRKSIIPENESPTKRRNIHISRQALRSEILKKIENNQNIKWGYKLENISHNTGGQIALEFQTDTTKKIDQADLVVGADGIRSTVRSLKLSEQISPLQYLGCIVILGICPLNALSNTELSLLDSATVFQTVNGHERIYIMPYDEKHIMWQLSFPLPEEDAKTFSKNGSKALQQEAIKRLRNWHAPIPEILKKTDPSQVTGYPVYDREILNPDYFKDFGSITLLGDAMHPMSPFKGQGANQALLDALDLARDIYEKCGPQSGWREKGLRDTVLKDFEQRMGERSALKVADSAKAVELLHSDAVLHEGDSPRGRGI
ncbi:FAD-dependent monooxygenase [Candidatus Gracilibacteria bacterium]|nr:FAD-dependent monooxygenase [Candidatus Gracilibacteria bacterium]